eukprot:363181-Chlamydomonas_euryale.AAC.15
MDEEGAGFVFGRGGRKWASRPSGLLRGRQKVQQRKQSQWCGQDEKIRTRIWLCTNKPRIFLELGSGQELLGREISQAGALLSSKHAHRLATPNLALGHGVQACRERPGGRRSTALVAFFTSLGKPLPAKYFTPVRQVSLCQLNASDLMDLSVQVNLRILMRDEVMTPSSVCACV